MNKKRVVWDGKWRVVVERLTLVDGTQFERESVEHPGSVVLVPLMGDEVIMLSQFRPNLNQTILELPAGTLDPNEEIIVCAQRELREETGYRAEKLIDLGQYWPAPGVTNEVMTLYLALNLHHDPLPQDIDEEIENRPMKLTDLVEMSLNGDIADLKSVVGILRAQRYLQQSKSSTRLD